VDADGPLTRLLGRLPPLDGPIEEPEALRAPALPNLAARVAGALAARTGAHGVLLRRSGREALRVALRAAAAGTGRDEVVLPAYTCWSVAAAAVAAGLKVRLADVDEPHRAARRVERLRVDVPVTAAGRRRGLEQGGVVHLDVPHATTPQARFAGTASASFFGGGRFSPDIRAMKPARSRPASRGFQRFSSPIVDEVWPR